MSTANKLTYLNTTKGKIKDSINITGVGITDNDTFRSYSTKLKDGIVDMINNGTETAYNNFPKVTDTGSNITLNDTYNSKLKVDLKGNTHQGDNPSPSNPQNIELVTGYNEVKIEDEDGTNSQSYEINLGKNLLDISDITNTDFITNNGDGSITLNGQAYGGVSFPLSKPFKLKANTTYALSLTNTDSSYAGGTFILRNGDTNKKLIEFITSSTTWTPTEDTLIDTLRIYGSNLSFNNFTFSVQLEENDHATSYSVYKTPIELCKIGEYQDEIYKENNKWYIHKEIGKVIYNGSEEDWTKHATTGGDLYMIYIPDAVGYGYGTGNTAPAICNSFIAKELGSFSDSTYGVFGITTNSQARFFVGEPGSHYGTLSAWKQYLSNNNLIVYYGLTTPTDTEITDTELINQLNELESANSYLEQTNITAEYISGNQPFDMSASALLKE